MNVKSRVRWNPSAAPLLDALVDFSYNVQKGETDVTAREGKRSAGLLMYRRCGGAVEVLLIHPGGPFWSGKDDGAWSIPKGLIDPGEDELMAAMREFEEETGFPAEGGFFALPPVRQPSGKVIATWAFEGDCDPAEMKSNLFSMEWPPRSGRMAEFPEADRAAWFDLSSARTKIIKGQRAFLEELERLLDINSHQAS